MFCPNRNCASGWRETSLRSLTLRNIRHHNKVKSESDRGVDNREYFVKPVEILLNLEFS